MSNFISKETIDAIINTSDIISIVGEYTKLERRSANDWWGCCPFHGEKTASFHVDGDKKFFHCFGCHASGNVIKFVMEMEKLSYVDTLQTLAKRAGIEIKYEDGYVPQKDVKQDNKIEQYIELYERTSTMFHYFLLETEQGKNALKYIKDRGLTLETIEKFKLGYAPKDRYFLKQFLRKKNFSDDFLKESGLFSKNYPDISFFTDRLMFPIFNRKGQVVAFGGRILHPQGPNDRKYLNSGDLIQYKKRETLFAFNLARNAIRENKKVIFCEGYMDCIAYHQSGIEYAVAPLGTALTEEQLKIIRGFAQTVLLSFDSDEAGQNATKRAILMCRKFDLTVRVIQLKGGKDPAEILLNYGKENLTAQVNNAILDSDYFLFRLGEKYPINTPDGKIAASREFFEYVDSLQSDIQKELSLEQLSHAFNIKPEAVKKDFYNRGVQTQGHANIRQNNQENQKVQIKLDAELRGLIAVTADLGQFNVLRSNLSQTDFKNPAAQKLYRILEECYTGGSFSVPVILSCCEDEQLERLITDVNSSGVYKDTDLNTVVLDTIKFIKKNQLDELRNNLIKRIREFTVVTVEDQFQLDQLLKQKMELDRQAQLLSK